MSEHVLIRLAHRFPATTVQPIAGWRYRRDIGAWVDCDAPDSLYAEGLVLANSSQPKPRHQPQPKPRPPITKKADMETGEDMKGE